MEIINWLQNARGFKFVVFGFNGFGFGLSNNWWTHRTQDHTQRFFHTLEEAQNWVKENHGLRGFSRNNSGQAQGKLNSYLLPSSNANTKWLGRVEIIQENFGYGELVKWYASREEGKTRNDRANWWIFRLDYQ
jgi:hypothetical protein